MSNLLDQACQRQSELFQVAILFGSRRSTPDLRSKLQTVERTKTSQIFILVEPTVGLFLLIRLYNEDGVSIILDTYVYIAIESRSPE